MGSMLLCRRPTETLIEDMSRLGSPAPHHDPAPVYLPPAPVSCFTGVDCTPDNTDSEDDFLQWSLKGLQCLSDVDALAGEWPAMTEALELGCHDERLRREIENLFHHDDALLSPPTLPTIPLLLPSNESCNNLFHSEYSDSAAPNNGHSPAPKPALNPLQRLLAGYSPTSEPTTFTHTQRRTANRRASGLFFRPNLYTTQRSRLVTKTLSELVAQDGIPHLKRYREAGNNLSEGDHTASCGSSKNWTKSQGCNRRRPRLSSTKRERQSEGAAPASNEVGGRKVGRQRVQRSCRLPSKRSRRANKKQAAEL